VCHRVLDVLVGDLVLPRRRVYLDLRIVLQNPALRSRLL
jgi:hypothetical protein